MDIKLISTYREHNQYTSPATASRLAASPSASQQHAPAPTPPCSWHFRNKTPIACPLASKV